jgi:hypothetical protein
MEPRMKMKKGDLEHDFLLQGKFTTIAPLS